MYFYTVDIFVCVRVFGGGGGCMLKHSLAGTYTAHFLLDKTIALCLIPVCGGSSILA